MHIHILGVCGTFMGGIAALAKQLGHRVTGSDANVYPPMSTQLTQLGIELIQGYEASQLSPEPDLVVVGNAMSRGNPAVEYMLDRNIPYMSGPEWLKHYVLKDRWVLAVAGTHGKTTTSSMLAWILEYAKLTPGFLIGGIPQNFGVSARLGQAPFFVIEADEYDTAFFDKRSKFVHYLPKTLVMNNLEFDHADIFNSLDDIQRQFHHLMRLVPSNGLVLRPENDTALSQVSKMGCWTPEQLLGREWTAKKQDAQASSFEIFKRGESQGVLSWSLFGEHNMANAMMAIAAAHHAGVPTHVAIEALGEFVNTKRRQELKGCINQIKVYDDFAHHPTAIRQTLDGLRAKVGDDKIIAVLEPRSNTMKQGVHRSTLGPSLSQADYVHYFEPQGLEWSFDSVLDSTPVPAKAHLDIDAIVASVVEQAEPDTHILVMSNGGFGDIHSKLLAALEKRYG